MSLFREMLIKRPSSHVHEISTNFTGIFHTQPMQFVQPIWNGFAVPCEGKFQWIVDFFGSGGFGIRIVEGSEHGGVVFSEESVEFSLAFTFSHALFPFNVDSGIGAFVGEEVGDGADAVFVGSDETFFEGSGGVFHGWSG